MSTILSVLDYGNSLIAGAPKHLVEKYEKIVRAVVRYIFRMRKFEPTTQNRRDLHLLDAYQRANYKVILWTWKAVHIKQPKILLDILPPRIINESCVPPQIIQGLAFLSIHQAKRQKIAK